METIHLILYSKKGCHLCEDVEKKLRQMSTFAFTLEIRDILSHKDWFNLYQYEIPVITYQREGQEYPIPRPSPRFSVLQLEKHILLNLRL